MLLENATYQWCYNAIYILTAYLGVLMALSSEIKEDILVQNKLSNYL